MNSDMGELFCELAEHSKIKRANNRKQSAQLLTERGVEFESKSAGVHLIVTARDGLVDFWPGTGKFIPRFAGRKGRGVFNLLKLCETKP